MSEKKVPVRTCVGCRGEFDKRTLYRIVRSKDGSVFLDKTGKANGRGAYFCGDKQCFKKIIKSRALQRALETEIPQELFTELEEVSDER